MEPNERSIKRKLSVIAVMMVLALLLSSCTQAPLRLHIMANSNSEQDQQIKLCVRDAVLEATSEGIKECDNATEARAYIENNLEIIETTANTALAQGGFDYEAHAQLGTFHFPEKKYQDVTYPEGEYEALRIALGEGEGENWWCVMFPPMCITELEIAEEQEVEYASLIAELFEKLFGESRQKD